MNTWGKKGRGMGREGREREGRGREGREGGRTRVTATFIVSEAHLAVAR